MGDICEFLLARLQDDENYLREIIRIGEAKRDSMTPGDVGDLMSLAMMMVSNTNLVELTDRWMQTRIPVPNDVHRLLREIELKKRIIARYERQAARANQSAIQEDRTWTLEPVLFDLAQVYDQHPDFKEEWGS